MDGLSGLIVVLALDVWATIFSLRHRHSVQQWLGLVIEPVRRVLLHHVTSRQHYPKDQVSPFFRVNAYPPTSPEYQRLDETIDLELARNPQTILPYEMNDTALPIPHGAPCRLRVETQLGFKMVKYLRSIELVHDCRRLGGGRAGLREDTQFCGSEGGI